MKLLKSIIIYFFILLLLIGCATAKPQKTAPKDVLDRLAKDLAEINLISEGMKEAAQPPEGVTILEALAPKKLKISTPSVTAIQEVLAGKVKVPCEKCPTGYAIAGIVNWGSATQPAWSIVNPEMYKKAKAIGLLPMAATQWSAAVETVMGKLPVAFYDYSLWKDPKSKESLLKTVSTFSLLTDRCKDLVKKALTKIQEIKKEYHNYLEIEGFDIQFPWSITLKVKLK